MMEAILAHSKVVDKAFSSIEQWEGSMDAQDLYVSSIQFSDLKFLIFVNTSQFTEIWCPHDVAQYS